ncbi:hypothetical protein ACQ4PT_016774 [Festuca glaucescens]
MGRRRSRRFRNKSSCVPRPPEPERDWTELHPDLISCFLKRLDQVELLIGGVATVCRSWRRARARSRTCGAGSTYAEACTSSRHPALMSASPTWCGQPSGTARGSARPSLCDRVYDDSLLAIAKR